MVKNRVFTSKQLYPWLAGICSKREDRGEQINIAYWINMYQVPIMHKPPHKDFEVE